MVFFMKLTSKSEYALLAMLFLARHKPEDEFVSGEVIARSQKIPVKFLQQILLSLKNARFIQSSKGQSGGYRLARPAGNITVAEIVRHFNGALAPTDSVSVYFYEPTPIEHEEKLHKLLKEIRDFVAAKMEKATLADLI